MNKELVILVGLPGSGKSYYGKTLIDENTYFLDDVNDPQKIVDLFKKYDRTIIADPHLCHDGVRLKAKDLLDHLLPSVSKTWIFWNNEVENAWKNICDRADGRTITKSFIQYLSDNYNPPYINKKVWVAE